MSRDDQFPKLFFPNPWWDSISKVAKVTNSLLMDFGHKGLGSGLELVGSDSVIIR